MVGKAMSMARDQVAMVEERAAVKIGGLEDKVLEAEQAKEEAE